MVRTDYHTHTPLCLHAEGEPEAFVARARQVGLSTYGIADHAPAPPEQEPFDDWRMRCADLPRYGEWIARAKAAAGDSLTVLAGLECDWLPGIAPWIARLHQQYPWDYLIGSVHYLRSLGAVDDSLYARRPLSGSEEEDWTLYGQAIAEVVRSGLFDIVGHIDLVKIWGRCPGGDLLRFFTPALDALEGSGMAVEINTAGWYKTCAEQYPSIPLLKELLRRRIPITINSDAHTPAHLSRDWERALSLLQGLTDGRLQQYCIPACTHPQTLLHVYGPL